MIGKTYYCHTLKKQTSKDINTPCQPSFNKGSRRKFHSESGRSMVEMLGVLAIVGVLSIGGIAGYNIAMNKYRLNEILDGANKRAIVISNQLMLETDTNLDEFSEFDETAGGTFVGVEILDNDQFGIKIDGVNNATCIGLIKSIGDKTPIRDITTQADTATPINIENCQEENNQLTLVFNNNLAINTATSSSGGENPDDPEQLPPCTISICNSLSSSATCLKCLTGTGLSQSDIIMCRNYASFLRNRGVCRLY